MLSFGFSIFSDNFQSHTVLRAASRYSFLFLSIALILLKKAFIDMVLGIIFVRWEIEDWGVSWIWRGEK